MQEEEGASGMDEDGNVVPPKPPALPVKEKLHLFWLDVAAAKQLRTPDILGHFADFGPSYVEWLGETSVNVQFEDEFSAKRALKAIGQDIPEPPVKEEAEVVQEGAAEVAMDEAGQEGGEEKAAEADAEAATEAATEAGEPSAEGADMADDDAAAAAAAAEVPKPEPTPHLGELGWSFCRRAIYKRSDDKFGRKGTKCRFLLRMANTRDCLEERGDVVELKMPKFSRDVVIDGRGGTGNNGQRRDDGERDNKRRKSDGRGRRDEGHYQREDNFDYAPQPIRNQNQFSVESAMETGLSSSRGGGGGGGGGGFTLAEIQAERAAKAAAAGVAMPGSGTTPKAAGGESNRWADQDSDDDL
jgi:hypothetical protein